MISPELTAAVAALEGEQAALRAAEGATLTAAPPKDADQRVIEARARLTAARAAVEREARPLLEEYSAELERSRRDLAFAASAVRATAPSLAAAATRHAALVEQMRARLAELGLTAAPWPGSTGLDNGTDAAGVTVLGRHWERFGTTQILAYVTLGERMLPRAGRDDPEALVAMAELLDDATDQAAHGR